MTLDLKALAAFVRQEVQTYEIPPHRPDALGSPLPTGWYEDNLAALRAGLVEPYLADVDCYTSPDGAAGMRQLAIVAKDQLGRYLAYDPMPDEGDFAMVGQEDGRLRLYNIRGNAVDTFLSF